MKWIAESWVPEGAEDRATIDYDHDGHFIAQVYNEDTGGAVGKEFESLKEAQEWAENYYAKLRHEDE